MAQATAQGPEEHRLVGHDKFDDLTWRQALGEWRTVADRGPVGRCYAGPVARGQGEIVCSRAKLVPSGGCGKEVLPWPTRCV